MSKITESARGEACTLRFPGVCNFNWETTVWAHGNVLGDGKAKGKKLVRYDHIGCYACYACHMVLDGQARRPAGLTLDFVRAEELRARSECEQKLKAKGLWPTDAFLASKPVTSHKPIVKKVTPLSARAIEKKVTPKEERSRAPVGAGRGFGGKTLSTAILSASAREEKARMRPDKRWPKRKLVSGNRLQSRPFGGR
ncbi:DUF1364 family protein [Burkholderia cenocepacia]|uniref:nuclease domain-containing protein n=1 Tax=Burkholderia cenocepacia TaxID=95486 RepID=UPI0023B9CB16|nr:nuclease domain-containing protein [Burkholderia cenocepacia]MDF0506578.1 DUF1364 family protein [Burkholderia cenocepacia]